MWLIVACVVAHVVCVCRVLCLQMEEFAAFGAPVPSRAEAMADVSTGASASSSVVVFAGENDDAIDEKKSKAGACAAQCSQGLACQPLDMT
jgi:hypothetical protein